MVRRFRITRERNLKLIKMILAPAKRVDNRDERQKTRRKISGFLLKNWRLPTLAEPIGLLPSARLCLTAEFGMGSGRTTALWPPRNGSQKPAREARIFIPNSALI